MLKCDISECNNKVIAKNLCNKHYQRWRTHGDANKVIERKRGICSVKDCGKPNHSHNLCSTHYAKMRNTGTLERIVFGPEWKKKMSAAMKSDLTKLDPTKDPKMRGYLAVNVVNDIKYKSLKRGKKWKLSNIEAYKLITSDCFYCGQEAGWPKTRNGIDRVDNRKGYSVSNCVSCCFPCNSLKRERSLDEFREWIKRVHEYQLSKNHATRECSHPSQTDFGVEIWCELCRKKAFS